MFSLAKLQRQSVAISFTRFIATASAFKSNATRKLPTPLVFLEGLGTPRSGWKDTWQTKLANQGYSSTAIYLQIRTTDVQPYPAELVTSLSKDLAKCIQKDLGFFPPVIIAQGFCTNVAEKYVESHPASGLVLVTPVDAEEAKKAGVKELISHETSLEPSIYEPNFPILLISDKHNGVNKRHRLHGDLNVDHLIVEQGEEANGTVNGKSWYPACENVARWLDEIGL